MQFDTRQRNNEAYLVHQRKRRRFFSRKMPAVTLPPSRIGLNVQFLISSWTLDPSPNPSFFLPFLNYRFQKRYLAHNFSPPLLKLINVSLFFDIFSFPQWTLVHKSPFSQLHFLSLIDSLFTIFPNGFRLILITFLLSSQHRFSSLGERERKIEKDR